MTENHASDLYDAVNNWGPSDDFFLGFVTTLAGARVLDLGCGTGQITIAAHLVPGGRLAFDSRDPNARGWEAWTKERTHKIVHLPQGDGQHWYQTTRVDEQAGVVDFCAHDVGPDGIERVECGPIRFRSEGQLRSMLDDAGLAVDQVFGGYHGEPVGHGVGTLTFTAHRP